MTIFLIVIIAILMIVISGRNASDRLHNFWIYMKEEELISLLAKGFDVNNKNSQGMTSLMFAASLNTNPNIIKLLIDNGARVNDCNMLGMTALHCCVNYNSNPEVAKILLEKGAKTEIKNRHGWTPLMSCCVNDSDWRFVKILLEYGANKNAVDHMGESIIEYMFKNDGPNTSNAKEIRKLLNNERY